MLQLIPPRGCAYVCFGLRRDAERALDKLKGYKLGGNLLKVNFGIPYDLCDLVIVECQAFWYYCVNCIDELMPIELRRYNVCGCASEFFFVFYCHCIMYWLQFYRRPCSVGTGEPICVESTVKHQTNIDIIPTSKQCLYRRFTLSLNWTLSLMSAACYILTWLDIEQIYW